MHVGYDEEDLTPLSGEIVPFSPLPLNAHQLIDCKDLESWLVDAFGPLDSHFLEADMNASLWVHKNVLKMSKTYGARLTEQEEGP